MSLSFDNVSDDFFSIFFFFLAEIRLYYDERGLDRYYGLLELGEIGGLWKNVAGRYEINGKKVYAKAIYKNPEEYFTPEVMQALDEIAQTEFSYGEG